MAVNIFYHVFPLKIIHFLQIKPNEYAGINLATLLVVSGVKVDHSTELQSLLIQLNHVSDSAGYSPVFTSANHFGTL